MSHEIITTPPEALNSLPEIERALQLMGFERGREYWVTDTTITIKAEIVAPEGRRWERSYQALGYRESQGRVQRVIDDMYVDRRRQPTGQHKAFEERLTNWVHAARCVAALEAKGLKYAIQTTVIGEIEIRPIAAAARLGAVKTSV